MFNINFEIKNVNVAHIDLCICDINMHFHALCNVRITVGKLDKEHRQTSVTGQWRLSAVKTAKHYFIAEVGSTNYFFFYSYLYLILMFYFDSERYFR